MLATILIIAGAIFCTFFFDSGRQILLNVATKCLEYNGIHCEIQGVTRNLSKIDAITLKTSKNSTLFASGISINKEHARFDVCINKVDFKNIEPEINFQKKSEQQKFQFQSFLPSKNEKLHPAYPSFTYLKMIRTFLNKLQVKDGVIDLPSGKHVIKNLSYSHVRSIDKLSCNLCDFGDESFVNLKLNWGTFKTKKAEISFEKIGGLSGVIIVENPEQNTSNYELHLNHEYGGKQKNWYKKNAEKQSAKIKIDSLGTIKYSSRTIHAAEVLLNYGGEIYKATGSASINAHCIALETLISCNDFINKYSTNTSKQAVESFKDVDINISAKYSLENCAKHEFVADFRRNKKSLGKLYGNFFDNQINIRGSVNWIDIYGYRLKSLDFKMEDFKNIFASIKGCDFTIESFVKIDDNISIEKAILEVPENGFLQLTKPFQIAGHQVDKNYAETDLELQNTASSSQLLQIQNPRNLSASFQFKKMDFFQKIASFLCQQKGSISGDCKGTFSYDNNSEFSVSIDGNKLKFPDYEVSDYHIICDALSNEKKLSFHANNVSVSDSIFHNISLDIAKNKWHASLKTSNDAIIDASGKISDSFQKISLNPCTISASGDINKAIFNIKNGIIDFEKNEYILVCELSNRKSKTPGILKFNSNLDSTTIDLSDFSVGILKAIVKSPLPRWCLNGSINLSHPRGISNGVSGNGHIIVSEFLCKRNTVEMRTKIGKEIQINCVAKNSKESICCDISIPMSLEKICKEFYKNPQDIPLNCHIFGSSHLEHLFELADGNDMRGFFSCNLKISGNFKSPKINGNAIMQDAHFVMGDVFLRRGNIGLVCSQDNIKVSNAEFIDNQNHKFTASGSGKFFCEGFITNIETDLSLVSNNYALFDSKDLKIRIKGNGKITGPIDNLLISGQVEATRCVVQNIDTEIEDSKGGITISNEKNIFPKKNGKEAQKKDFCKYDIEIKCPKVDVIGDIYELHFGGNLHLTTYNDVASLEGSLVLKNGKLDLFGKKMMVRKGKVEFFEQYPLDPRLSVLFYNNFGDMIVYLKVKNVPQKGGSFNIYSVPSSSPELILSNMLFGKDLKNLSVSEAAQFAQAIASFNKNGGLFSIMNGLKKTGIVDTISFSTSVDNDATKSLNTNSQTSKSSTNINVTAGKYIGDKVFVSVNKRSDNSTSFDIDYAITPKISVKANTNGEAGINWRYKY